MNPIDVMFYGQRTTLRAIESLAPGDWLRPGALGTWTVKDIVGHLGAFEKRMVEVLGPFAGEAIEPVLMAVVEATFNDVQAAVRAGWTVVQVMAEFQDAHVRVMELARRIPGKGWREVGTIPWYGPEYSLDDLVVYQIYGHKREHSAQIDSARSPGDQASGR